MSQDLWILWNFCGQTILIIQHPRKKKGCLFRVSLSMVCSSALYAHSIRSRAYMIVPADLIQKIHLAQESKRNPQLWNDHYYSSCSPHSRSGHRRKACC